MRPTGASTAPWRARSATPTRCSSRRWPSSAWSAWRWSLGFLGFALVSGIRRGPTRAREGALGAALAILAAGIASAAIDWTWELPACFGLVVVAAALLTGPATLRRPPLLSAVPSPVDGEPGAGLEAGASSRFGLGIATLVVGWAAIWAGGDQFLTELRLTDSRDAASAGELSSAAQDARDASTLQPWAAEPRLQLALVEELDGDLRGRQPRPRRGDRARPRRLAALVRAGPAEGEDGRRRGRPAGPWSGPESSTPGPRSWPSEGGRRRAGRRTEPVSARGPWCVSVLATVEIVAVGARPKLPSGALPQRGESLPKSHRCPPRPVCPRR